MEDKFVSNREEHYKQPGEVPEEFAGMSFWDLINSGKGNAIPTVDKIVNAKNPEDGKIYLTFFAKDKISCCEPGGEKVWEQEISNGEQRSLIKEFFENYAPDRSYVKEYYSDESLGRVSSKEFWIGYLENASSLNTSQNLYETADPDDDDIRYITWYTEKGIFCRKAGQTEGYEWAITFENKEQYDKVMEFIGQFPSDWNIRFAAHENFWNDFLKDEIDMDGFMEFINGTNKGVPDYSITIGDSMYIDEEKCSGQNIPIR